MVWRFIGVLPAPTSVQPTERISLCSCPGGPRGGSWSGLPWLSYTSRGRKPKIRFLTSLPRRASWCLESRLMHHYGITPLVINFSISQVIIAVRLWVKYCTKIKLGLRHCGNFVLDTEQLLQNFRERVGSFAQ